MTTEVAARRVGPFRLLAQLGEGGFAPVFLAVEEHGNVELRNVALKLFRPGTAVASNGRGVRDVILAEARALCRVEHPNIIRFFQIVEDGPVVALAMEYVHGRSVAARVAADGRLPLETTLAIGAAIASALAAVHAAGLVHRDVKPDNVIDAGDVYKLIDFGIAARAKPKTTVELLPSQARLVPSHAPPPLAVEIDGKTMVDTHSDEPDTTGTAGTIGYIDPACFGRELVPTAASDLYGLGATLFELLTGKLPATAMQTDGKLSLAIAMGLEPPPPVNAIDPSIPEDIARLVDALVAPRREDRPKHAEWVAVELERLARAKRTSKEPLPPEGPFRGLAAFRAEDRDILFGRSGDVASALDILRLRGLAALVGASGSGKTSLARAGLVPAIVDGALGAWPPRWESVTFTPGRDVRLSVETALAGWIASLDRIADQLAAAVDARATGLVILVDALEEIVTLSDPASAWPLLAFLEDVAANARPGLRVVVTVRRDLLDPILAFGSLGPSLLRGMHLVAPLSPAALTQALDDRLAAYGYALGSGAMRATLTRDLAASAESMPLVEFALARLWNERDERTKTLPEAALERIGGLAGALEQHAEDTFARLETIGDGGQRLAPSMLAEDVARRIFLALTTARGTRTRKTPEELAADVPSPLRDRVVTHLERARLVTRDEGRLTLAHEALLSQWRRLDDWTSAARRDRELVEDLENAAEKWREHRKDDRLFRGDPLAQARRIEREQSLPLTSDARAFLRASHRWQLRSRAGVVGLVLALAAGGLVFAFLYFRAAAETESDRRKVRLFAQEMFDNAKKVKESDAQKEVEELVSQHHQCQKALAQCAGDAGAK